MQKQLQAAPGVWRYAASTATMTAGAAVLAGLAIHLARSLRQYQQTAMAEPLYAPVEKVALLLAAGVGMMLVIGGFAVAMSTFLHRRAIVTQWRQQRG